MFERPHSWCNYANLDGHVLDTIYTADFWEWCLILEVRWNGAHVHFFKRTAPNRFDFFGGFIEGLEKTEEDLLKMGVDIPALSAQIAKSGDMAKHDHETEPDDPQGLIIGGLWGPHWDWLESYYAQANHAANTEHPT